MFIICQLTQETEDGKVPSPKAPEEKTSLEKSKTPPPKSPEENPSAKTEGPKKEGRTPSPQPVKTESEEIVEDSPKTPVIEVANEEEKALLEAELIKQQQLNKWPKDKFLMQRAEHVCFCITQGIFSIRIYSAFIENYPYWRILENSSKYFPKFHFSGRLIQTFFKISVFRSWPRSISGKFIHANFMNSVFA